MCAHYMWQLIVVCILHTNVYIQYNKRQYTNCIVSRGSIKSFENVNLDRLSYALRNICVF